MPAGCVGFFQGLIHSVIFKFADVIIRKITLMSSDAVPLSSAVWGGISGEGTSDKCVRVNFPGLGSRPSLSSSHVTVLGFSLEKPAVINVAVLPGQSQRNSRAETWQPSSSGVQRAASSILPPFSLLLLQWIVEFHFRNRGKWEMKKNYTSRKTTDYL